LGERIIRAATHWAAGFGADTVWAQVATTNAASLALQQRVGLREVYRYRYLVKP
jgi:RimJ/RimL family protein N-acetyltransferase